RTGIVGILDTDPAIEVVAQAADGAEALRKIDAHRLDVALFDIQMPGMSGLDALHRLRSDGSALPSLFVTPFGEDDYIAEAIRLGQGETNAEIATALHLAPGTVKVHVSAILRTTEARNRVEAALIALRAGRA